MLRDDTYVLLEALPLQLTTLIVVKKRPEGSRAESLRAWPRISLPLHNEGRTIVPPTVPCLPMLSAFSPAWFQRKDKIVAPGMCSRPVTSSGPTPNTTPSFSAFGATTQLSPRTSALSTPAHIAQYVEDLVSPSLDRYGSGATVGRLSPRVQASHNVEDLALTSHASAHHLLGCRPSTPMHGGPSWQFELRDAGSRDMNCMLLCIIAALDLHNHLGQRETPQSLRCQIADHVQSFDGSQRLEFMQQFHEDIPTTRLMKMEKFMLRPSHCCLLSFITMLMLTGVFSVTNQKYLVLILSCCWSNLRVQIESRLRRGRRLPVSETKCNRDHIGLGVFLHDANEYTHSTLHSGCMV